MDDFDFRETIKLCFPISQCMAFNTVVCRVLFCRLIDKISPTNPRESFLQVAGDMFSDGVYNWGRVVALFYFGFKLVMRVFEQYIIITVYYRFYSAVDSVENILETDHVRVKSPIFYLFSLVTPQP